MNTAWNRGRVIWKNLDTKNKGVVPLREISILKKLGFTTVPESYYTKIDLWKRWYQGYVKEHHDYYWYNGQQLVPMKKLQAGMAKKVAEDWADLSLNEKVSITLEGKAEQEFWDSVCKTSKWRKNASKNQELTFALGTTAIVARVSGLTVNENGEIAAPAKSVTLDFVRADHIFPLAWARGEILDCAFSQVVTGGEKEYLYLQIHVRDDRGEYDVFNHFFDTSSRTAKEVNASAVKGYENVPSVFHTGSTQRLFVINTPNIVNNVDLDCPMGISVYANALHQLGVVDNVFSGFDGEIQLGRKRVAVQPEGLKSVDGKPVFDPSDIAFYVLPTPKTQNPQTIIEELGGDLRIDEYEKAMQLALNKLSLKCGLGCNHWKFSASGGITTATEVISANSDEFRTLKKHEITINDCIMELIHIVLMLGNKFCGKSLNEGVAMSVDFDDSIIEDTNTDFERDCRMLSMGIISRVEFRMRWRNEDEKTAEKALPKLEELSDEPPEE